MSTKKLVSLWVVVAMACHGCGGIAVAIAPKKRAVESTSLQAKSATANFWQALHGGKYEAIDGLIEEHMRAIYDNPNDPTTLSHLAFLHAWKVSERARIPPSATLVGSVSVARRYYQEALMLVPNEPRYLGFLGAFTLTEGAILKNEKEVRSGYFLMKDGVTLWPEFNLFTFGYLLSDTPVEGPRFKEALEAQWATLDRCFGTRIDRAHPTAAPYLGLETQSGPKRACWNSSIAPHNWEGFFLNFGDMLIRQGDIQTAKAMYQNAMLSRNYQDWPYRDVLTHRLEGLDSLRARFAVRPHDPEYSTMINTRFSCTACHQGNF